MTKALFPLWTRRHLLAGAGLLAPLPGFAQTIRATPGMQPLDDKDATQDSAAQDSSTLAARTDANNHLTIAVMINGKGPFRFIVDTGAERSVIAGNVAAALELPPGKSIVLEGIGGRVTAGTVHVEALSFGPFRRSNLNLPVLPRRNLFADGYLGLDVINGTRVTFDFANHAITIEQPRDSFATDGPDTARVRAKGNNGRLRVMDCMVNSVGAIAFVDTGAEVSVGNRALYNKLISRNHSLDSSAVMTLTGITGGTVIGELIPIYRIRLRELSFTDGTLVIADVPDFSIWKVKEDRPALLIGMDYLRQFASVTIDYRNKEIRFEISQAPPYPSPGVVIEHTA